MCFLNSLLVPGNSNYNISLAYIRIYKVIVEDNENDLLKNNDTFIYLHFMS